jgi:hypothetical protein
MRSPRIRVVLGELTDACADVVIRPGARPGQRGRQVTVPAPRWHPPNGPRHELPAAYRAAVAEANAREATSMALPAVLARGPWPLDEVTSTALNVLRSTPTTVLEVTIVAATPAMVERWAEALAREAPPGGWHWG